MPVVCYKQMSTIKEGVLMRLQYMYQNDNYVYSLQSDKVIFSKRWILINENMISDNFDLQIVFSRSSIIIYVKI